MTLSNPDRSLADKVVALGVGESAGTLSNPLWEISGDYGNGLQVAAWQFVRDWRVAGALMEKCWSVEIDKIGCPWWVAAERPKKPQKFCKAKNESLPRAIIEACVEALSSDQPSVHNVHGVAGIWEVTHSEQIIEIERLQREATRSRLDAMKSAARYKRQSDQIDSVLEMFQVWSAFNLAAMWGYRDSDETRQR